MADSQKIGKKSKRKREHKVSNGIHGGGGKVSLSYIQKILMGKGVLDRPVKVERKASERERTNRG